MGFFSELKEDLSQAVNELNEQIMTDGEETENVLPVVEYQPAVEQEPAAETAEQETAAEAMTLSLEEMLENIDSISLPDELMGELEETQTKPWEEQNSSGEESVSAEESGEPEGEEQLSVEDQEIEQEMAEAEAVEEASAESEDPEMAALLEQMVEEIPPEDQEEQTSEIEIEESKGAENIMENNTERIAVDETSVITEGMMITGDIITEGSIDLVGTVNGNIDALGKLNITGHINGNSKAAEIYAESAKINGEIVSEGAVKIGASSVVIGNITATSAAIAGAVKGDIDVHGPVILDASAIVMGNIKSKSVQINNGAVIEGMCSQCYADVSPTSFFDDYKPEARKTKSK